jgi:ABC-type glycerol-3-phosphate transport system substrate-binding protein
METKQEARGVALPYLNSGYKDLDVFEVNNGVITVLYKDLLTGKKTVQDILDIYQANWEKMYTIPK